MTFTDYGSLEVENYILRRGEDELYIYLEASYTVECFVEMHSHCCPPGEDYPDGVECDCIEVSVDYYEVYDTDGNELSITLTKDEIRSIEMSLYEAAEEHYAEYGEWRLRYGH